MSGSRSNEGSSSGRTLNAEDEDGSVFNVVVNNYNPQGIVPTHLHLTATSSTLDPRSRFVVSTLMRKISQQLSDEHFKEIHQDTGLTGSFSSKLEMLQQLMYSEVIGRNFVEKMDTLYFLVSVRNGVLAEDIKETMSRIPFLMNEDQTFLQRLGPPSGHRQGLPALSERSDEASNIDRCPPTQEETTTSNTVPKQPGSSSQGVQSAVVVAQSTEDFYSRHFGSKMVDQVQNNPKGHALIMDSVLKSYAKGTIYTIDTLCIIISAPHGRLESQQLDQKLEKSLKNGDLRRRLLKKINPRSIIQRMSCLCDVTKQQIEREEITVGSEMAAGVLLNNIIRFDGWGAQFLDALHGTGQATLASKLHKDYVPPSDDTDDSSGDPPDDPPDSPPTYSEAQRDNQHQTNSNTNPKLTLSQSQDGSFLCLEDQNSALKKYSLRSGDDFRSQLPTNVPSRISQNNTSVQHSRDQPSSSSSNPVKTSEVHGEAVNDLSGRSDTGALTVAGVPEGSKVSCDTLSYNQPTVQHSKSLNKNYQHPSNGDFTTFHDTDTVRKNNMLTQLNTQDLEKINQKLVEQDNNNNLSFRTASYLDNTQSEQKPSTYYTKDIKCSEIGESEGTSITATDEKHTKSNNEKEVDIPAEAVEKSLPQASSAIHNEGSVPGPENSIAARLNATNIANLEESASLSGNQSNESTDQISTSSDAYTKSQRCVSAKNETHHETAQVRKSSDAQMISDAESESVEVVKTAKKLQETTLTTETTTTEEAAVSSTENQTSDAMALEPKALDSENLSKPENNYQIKETGFNHSKKNLKQICHAGVSAEKKFVSLPTTPDVTLAQNSTGFTPNISLQMQLKAKGKSYSEPKTTVPNSNQVEEIGQNIRTALLPVESETIIGTPVTEHLTETNHEIVNKSCIDSVSFNKNAILSLQQVVDDNLENVKSCPLDSKGHQNISNSADAGATHDSVQSKTDEPTCAIKQVDIDKMQCNTTETPNDGEVQEDEGQDCTENQRAPVGEVVTETGEIIYAFDRI